ncbi:MAG: ABC transporter permease, partial [Gemmatimonadetes bacterium]|nr:ABC transporter permease [Gemmatimonadota bacterium]
TIAVASVGLFGLAAHAAQARTREIGIRKVFGGSPGRIAAMLMRDFARPVAVAFLLSVPIAYGLADHWLQDFAYRVEIGAGLFLVSGVLSFAIAGVTVGGQAMRAALANPARTLHTQ